MKRSLFGTVACFALASGVCFAQQDNSQTKTLEPTNGTQEFALGGSITSYNTSGTTLTSATALFSYGRFLSPRVELRAGGLVTYASGSGSSETLGAVLVGPKYYLSYTGRMFPYVFLSAEGVELSVSGSFGGGGDAEGLYGGVGIDYFYRHNEAFFAEVGYTELWGSGSSLSSVGLTLGISSFF